MRSFLRYNVIYTPDEDGGYMVTVPTLPGCVSYGATLEEAKEMIKDAIFGYVLSLEKHNEPVPTDEGGFLGTIEMPQVIHA